MEIFGYIIGSLTLITGAFITIIRKMDEKINTARLSIKNEFLNSYKEFSSIFTSQTIDTKFVNISIDRLKKYHYSSILDILKIGKIENFLNIISYFIWINIIIVIIFLITGHLLFSESCLFIRMLFIIILPLLFLIIQCILLSKSLTYDKYLKKVEIKYNNKDY